METSIFSELNWLAILVAAAAWFVLGALWYSPVLFSKKWIAYHNISVNDADAKKGMATIMICSFVLMLLAVTGLALLVERMELSVLASGVKLGLLTGFCFAMTAISITYLYVKKPLGLHLIDGLYHVIGHVLAAVILCLWQ